MSDSQRLDALETHFRGQRILYERTVAEEECLQLQAEGYHLDRDAEVDRMGGSLDGMVPAMTPEQRARHVAHIRQYHERSGGGITPSAMTQAQRDQVVAYMATHPDADYKRALEDVLHPTFWASTYCA
jgi:hypothetical protein